MSAPNDLIRYSDLGRRCSGQSGKAK